MENTLSTRNASHLLAGWNFNTAGRYPGSCPIIAQGLAYLGSSDGHLYALDAYTGSQKWSIALGSTYTANLCPAVVNHILYIRTNSGSLLALNAATGTPVWSVKMLSQEETAIPNKKSTLPYHVALPGFG